MDSLNTPKSTYSFSIIQAKMLNSKFKASQNEIIKLNYTK